jgi:hypothetical protein
MPLPDKYADEPTVEVDKNLYDQWLHAKKASEAWEKIAKGYRQALISNIGEFAAATVNGVKVLSYRPSEAYAEKRMQEEFPDLTEHYTHEVTTKVFDVDLFVRAHPEIAEKFRVRTFREIQS